MSQRYHSVEKEIEVNLSVKVKLKQFSNHDGFKEGQIERAIEEFEEVIGAHLLGILVNDYYQDGLLQTVDYVNYEIL
jgi:hypothetical protein